MNIRNKSVSMVVNQFEMNVIEKMARREGRNKSEMIRECIREAANKRDLSLEINSTNQLDIKKGVNNE